MQLTLFDTQYQIDTNSLNYNPDYNLLLQNQNLQQSFLNNNSSLNSSQGKNNKEQYEQYDPQAKINIKLKNNVSQSQFNQFKTQNIQNNGETINLKQYKQKQLRKPYQQQKDQDQEQLEQQSKQLEENIENPQNEQQENIDKSINDIQNQEQIEEQDILSNKILTSQQIYNEEQHEEEPEEIQELLKAKIIRKKQKLQLVDSYAQTDKQMRDNNGLNLYYAEPNEIGVEQKNEDEIDLNLVQTSKITLAYNKKEFVETGKSLTSSCYVQTQLTEQEQKQEIDADVPVQDLIIHKDVQHLKPYWYEPEDQDQKYQYFYNQKNLADDQESLCKSQSCITLLQSIQPKQEIKPQKEENIAELEFLNQFE